MKIAIDVSAMAGTQGGMNIYLREIVRHMARLEPENEYLLYLTRWRRVAEARAALAPLEGANVRSCVRRFPFKLLMNLENRLGLPVEETLLLPTVDLFHGACQMVPPLRRTPSVMTVHHFEDTRYHYATEWDKFYFWDVYQRSLERADQVIADSQYTKDYLMKTFGTPAERITVVYHGIFDPVPRYTEEQKEAHRREFGLPPRYLVCVSHMTVRKNTVRLVRSFARVAERFPDLKLVLVGQAHPTYVQEVRAAIAAARLEDKVILTGPVPHAKVPLFFATAEMFVLPSLLEGFGIPLIEAMAMGCPIAASNTTSIPEVVGDAGLLFDPENEDEMTQAILRVLEDEALRKELVRKGQARASSFTWENAARRTLEVYGKALG